MKSVCGGALLTSGMVLTAGHCFCEGENDNAGIGQRHAKQNSSNEVEGVIRCNNNTLGKYVISSDAYLLVLQVFLF